MQKLLAIFFSNAVKKIWMYIYQVNDSIVSYDPIDEIVYKYANHPSIKLITENIVKVTFLSTQLPFMMLKW